MEPSINPERAHPEAPRPEGYGALGSLDLNVGDIDAAMRDSPVVVTGSYVQPSRHNNPMEPSAILAVWDGGQLTVYDSVQHLYAVQNALAAVFDIETTEVRVVSPFTGGGFGAKAYTRSSRRWPRGSSIGQSSSC
jgi:xanthine dehydrogenase YagR molybdenum-binding subunit